VHAAANDKIIGLWQTAESWPQSQSWSVLAGKAGAFSFAGACLCFGSYTAICAAIVEGAVILQLS